MERSSKMLYIAFIFCLIGVVSSVTDPNDAKVLSDFRKGLENPEVLKWPKNGIDPCGPPSWPQVFCSNGRVTQIQLANLGLIGTLPQNFNHLTELYNIGLQRNHFRGKLPSFSGLSQLQFAYLDFNEFDSIPADFFHGLSSIRVLALDSNPFNSSTGWSIPDELQDSVQLTNFSCFSCNIAGPLPEFFGRLPSLNSLRLSYNRLTGPIPTSFRDSMLQVLWLNDQDSGGMSGTIEVIGTLLSLTQVWLHGNSFTGSIPDSIGSLTSLRELNLNRNQLVGLVPTSLAKIDLELLDLNNNVLMGAIPKFRARNVTFSSNSFCQPIPGLQCSTEVNVLLDFLRDLRYPLNLASQWSGNDPCKGPWLGLSCNSKGEVFIINLPRQKLNGTLSPSLQKLSSLTDIHLGGNNISGQVPSNLTELRSLRLLDISGNNFQPPLPEFRESVKVNADSNPLLVPHRIQGLPSQPPASNPSPISHSPSSSHASNVEKLKSSTHTRLQAIILLVALGVSAIISLGVGIFCFLSFKKGKDIVTHPRGIVVHPRDPYDSEDMVKITVCSDTSRSLQSYSGNCSEAGNQVISAQLLQKVTNNFAPENELGRGGFGAVYKGEFDDGTKIAVKRMETGVVASKAVNEFQAEISVLSKVRHRHLVSLLGYAIEGKEKLLVYEYMPQGALSRHLFRWKFLNLEPLSWFRRLTIALDVARGLEYLHTLAQQSFIHRDLKSSNILLGDDFRAKVSDFGLVKLAPDREKSVATMLAGTFGYLAPEYAVTGKITTKADVFSFGVVLMELLTGLVALDEDRSEENRYLAEWFLKIKSNPEKLISAIDPSLDLEDDILHSIHIVAELAGHCTFRDPTNRPDMGYVVTVLSPLVDTWKPLDGETEECFSIDHRALALPEMLKDWQETEGDSMHASSMSIEDLKWSIPGRPSGFADSFTSADAR